MPNRYKRITLTITSDRADLMDEAKQIFYNRTQSEMIRTLVTEGLKAVRAQGEGDGGAPRPGR